eukprot:COSAG01_NODE_22841_length_839_cov_0.835135_1_plen_172_part_10
MAITPAAPGSYEGADVYSGAMVQDDDGSVISFFACACGDAKPPGGHNDAVCYARSTDPNVTTFLKYNGTHGSVILYIPEALGAAAADFLPEAGSQFVFRNETDGSWLMAVGSGRKSDPDRGSMAVLLFSAPDLHPESTWQFVGPLYSGGGRQGGAWCPYYAVLDGDEVMLAM